MAAVHVVFSLPFPKNATLHIGNIQGSGNMTSIQIIIDPFQNDTLIASSDFECIKSNGCWLESDWFKSWYREKVIIYKIGHAAMNFVDYQFNSTTSFLYLLNGTDSFGSVIGFNKDSSFLAYFYEQNKRLTFDMKVRVGPENKVSYLKEDPVGAIDLVHATHGARLVVEPENTTLDGLGIRFCFNPVYDYWQGQKSYIGIRQSHVDMWYDLLNRTDARTNTKITVMLMNHDQLLLVNFTLPGSELIDKSGNLMISTFSNRQNDDCDIVSGTYLLKELNYSLYYHQGAESFTVQNLIWVKDFQIQKTQFRLWNIIVILILLCVFIVVIYYGYKYYFWHEQEVRVSEEYRTLGFDPVEMKETIAAQNK